jgi:hypothetical protein
VDSTAFDSGVGRLCMKAGFTFYTNISLLLAALCSIPMPACGEDERLGGNWKTGFTT